MDIKDRQNSTVETTGTPEGLSAKEQRYYRIMQELVQNKISLPGAAEQLGITQRQVRNKLKRIREEGFSGLAHKNRGKPSNRRLPDNVVEEIKVIIGKESSGLGATALAQLIKDKHNIQVSRETIRKLMKEQGVPTRGKRRTKKQTQNQPKTFNTSAQTVQKQVSNQQELKSPATSSLGGYMNKDEKNKP